MHALCLHVYIFCKHLGQGLVGAVGARSAYNRASVRAAPAIQRNASVHTKAYDVDQLKAQVGGSIKTIKKVPRSPWLHGNLSRQEAEERLSGGTDGSVTHSLI